MKSSCYFFNKKSFRFTIFTYAKCDYSISTSLHSYYIANIIMKTFTLKSNISDWNRLNWFMHKWCMLRHDIHILNQMKQYVLSIKWIWRRKEKWQMRLTSLFNNDQNDFNLLFFFLVIYLKTALWWSSLWIFLF